MFLKFNSFLQCLFLKIFSLLSLLKLFLSVLTKYFFTKSVVQPVVIITPVFNSTQSGVNKGSHMTTSLSNLSVSQKSEKVVFQCPTGLINWKSPTAEASFAFQFSPLELFHSVASLNELRPCTTCGSMNARVCILVNAYITAVLYNALLPAFFMVR